MDDQKELRCSFCGAGSNEVEKLIKGVNAYICNVCIGDGYDLIQEHNEFKHNDVLTPDYNQVIDNIQNNNIKQELNKNEKIKRKYVKKILK